MMKTCKFWKTLEPLEILDNKLGIALVLFRTTFRQGIVVGDKTTIYPIMKICLEKFNEMKKRAYLANFLVKINIPGDYMSDMQLNDLYAQVVLLRFFRCASRLVE